MPKNTNEQIMEFFSAISNEKAPDGNTYADKIDDFSHSIGISKMKLVDDILYQVSDAKDIFASAMHNVRYLFGQNATEGKYSVSDNGDFTILLQLGARTAPNRPLTKEDIIQVRNEDIASIVKSIYSETGIDNLIEQYPDSLRMFKTPIGHKNFYKSLINSILIIAQDAKKKNLYTVILNILVNRAQDILLKGDASLRQTLFDFANPEIKPLKNAPAGNAIFFNAGKDFRVKPNDKKRSMEDISKAITSLIRQRYGVNESINSKHIIITESMAKMLKEEMSFTPFKFMGHIRKFLSNLLSDPSTAKPSAALIANGLDKIKLLKLLDSNGIIQKTMRLSDRDENNQPKSVTMKVRYQVPKKGFDEKLEKLYYSTIGANGKSDTGILDEVTGCSGGCGGFACPDNTGSYEQPILSKPLRKKKKSKKSL